MAQHKRITLGEVEKYLDHLEQENHHTERAVLADLLRTLVVVDAFLVKHDQTRLARQLRQAYDRVTGGIG